MEMKLLLARGFEVIDPPLNHNNWYDDTHRTMQAESFDDVL